MTVLGSALDEAAVERSVTGLAVGLSAAGLAMLGAPRLVGRLWFGADEPPPEVRAVVRALGARDLAFGLGIGLAQRHGAPLRGWLEAAAFVGAMDGVVSLAAWRHLPWTGRWGVGVGSLFAAGAIGALARRVR